MLLNKIRTQLFTTENISILKFIVQYLLNELNFKMNICGASMQSGLSLQYIVQGYLEVM